MPIGSLNTCTPMMCEDVEVPADVRALEPAGPAAAIGPETDPPRPAKKGRKSHKKAAAAKEAEQYGSASSAFVMDTSKGTHLPSCQCHQLMLTCSLNG